MPYDDDEYLRYSEMLDEAVAGLLENDIDPDDIRGQVTTALKNAGA